MRFVHIQKTKGNKNMDFMNINQSIRKLTQSYQYPVLNLSNPSHVRILRFHIGVKLNFWNNVTVTHTSTTPNRNMKYKVNFLRPVVIDRAFSSSQSFACSLSCPRFVGCVHTVNGKTFPFDQISVKFVSQHFEMSWLHVATVNRNDAVLKQQTVQWSFCNFKTF